jgi:hypothetical protein
MTAYPIERINTPAIMPYKKLREGFGEMICCL